MSPLLADGASDEHATPALSRDIAAICTEAIHGAMRVDRADTANLQLFDPSTGGLRIIAQHGFNRAFLDYFELVDTDDDSACGNALKRGRSVWVAETARSAIFAGTPALEVMLDARSRAVASVPIRSPSGRLIAMISTHHHRRRTWSDERKHELERIARATGRVLHKVMPNRLRTPL